MRCMAATSSTDGEERGEEEEAEGLSPQARVSRLKAFLSRLHASAPSHAQASTRSLIVHLIEGKVSLGSFTKDYEAMSKSRLGAGTLRLLELGLPLLREEFQGPLERQLLFQSLLPPTLPPTLTPHLSLPSNPLLSPSALPPTLSQAPGLHNPRKRKLPPSLTSPVSAAGSWTEGSGLGAVSDPPGTTNPPALDLWAWYAEEWRHIENLFTALSTSMERLRYSMLLFQQRARLSQLWTQELYQRQHPPNSQVLQRKADVAVAEVKRIAVSELAKAVTAAEAKAAAVVAEERARSRRLLASLSTQEARPENCWNCGRPATQTCSACATARYCGPFCQSKDWSRHRANCQLENVGCEVKTERVSPSSSSPPVPPTSLPPASPPPRNQPSLSSSV